MTVPAFAGSAWAVGALADPDAQKAAIKCQQLIAKTTTKALATKLKAFNTCAAAALACVQTKFDKADCPTKAAATCTKQLGSAAAAAVKAKTKITSNKSCAGLETPALLGADGLGFGDIAGSCATDLGIDVCGGLSPLVDCLLASHDQGAGALFGRAEPRTGELLSQLPGAPLANTTGLPLVPGCGTCNVQDTFRKPVEKCGKTLATATQAVAGALESSFGKCTLALYECAQGKDGDAECLTKATAACTKEAAKVTKATAKLATAVGKGCGTDFSQIGQTGGLNLDALASRCATLGVTPLDGFAAVSACLTAEARCAIAGLVRSAIPRTAEFDAASALGGLDADLGATCPVATSLQKARIGRAPRGVFGSILKLVKGVTRSVPSAVGTRTNGSKPASNGGGGGPGISKVSGPKRTTFGGISKFHVTYHGARSRVGGGGGADVTPPSLIIAVSAADIQLDDHFEIPLIDLPGDGSDVEDDIDVEFADTIPACAFNIDFATLKDGEVSDYDSVLQVLDGDVAPPVPPDLLTRGPAGVQQGADAVSESLAVTPNGRFAVYASAATNLVSPLETDALSDVYVRDRCVADGLPVAGCTPTTTLESIQTGPGALHQGVIGHVGISDDGRYIAFDAVDATAPNRIVTFQKDRCISNGQPVASCTVIVTDVTFETETFNDGGTLTWLSGDGRYAAFESDTVFGGRTFVGVWVVDTCQSPNGPIGGCFSNLDDISRSSAGGEANDASGFGVVSRGGRYVAYRSFASDLLPAGQDTNGTNDVYFLNRCLDPLTGNFDDTCSVSLERVNLTPAGTESVGDDAGVSVPSNIAISDNGRYVAFVSIADDLLPSGVDTNGARDVFVRDRCRIDSGPVSGCTPATERVNVGPGGTQSNGTIPNSPYVIGMSADGRFVVFTTDATNMVGPATGPPDGVLQVFQHDRCLIDGTPVSDCTPATTLISAAADKGKGIASSVIPAIAKKGGTVVFQSAAPNLLGPGVDANGFTDVFAKDR